METRSSSSGQHQNSKTPRLKPEPKMMKKKKLVQQHHRSQKSKKTNKISTKVPSNATLGIRKMDKANLVTSNKHSAPQGRNPQKLQIPSGLDSVISNSILDRNVKSWREEIEVEATFLPKRRVKGLNDLHNP
ncbi:hypothetical protein RIF29_31158 [Crotalaria pallida]|uniref:Uncharacterized protein n=1 Tax=Crotalaria pallida TaxID=3830 RepID=A0AAN9HYN2_CROPI